MLDSFFRPLIDPPLKYAARAFENAPFSANQVTLAGFGIGMLACLAVMLGFYAIALGLLLVNRLFDGLDGAVARLKGETSDFGGYLDILLDFVIYGGFPFFAAMGMMTDSAFLAAAFVLFAMICCGVSFLAYAIIAEKREHKTEAQGKKSFFFSHGLMEGSETIMFLCLICLIPDYFEPLCFTFGILCLITAFLRVRMAAVEFE